MKPPSEIEALDRITQLMGDLLGIGPNQITLTHPKDCPHIDAAIRAGRWKFLIEYKTREDGASVARAIAALKSCSGRSVRDHVLLVVVPYMGELGRRKCAEAGVSWFDLSGNANLTAPNFRVIIEGKPNHFRYPGRPSSVFAPKSSRIVRWLLIHPERIPSQREIGSATGMDEGFTSRIVSRLIQSGLVVKDREGKVLVPDRRLLLDAWHERYDFHKHEIFRGHVPARTGYELLLQAGGTLRKNGIAYAATGLAGAWLIDHFANFRLVTIFVADFPPVPVLEEMSYRDESRGSNIWLVIPNDPSVLVGAEEREGVNCVHPLQAYLDLKAHPERAREAAESLRAAHLNWGGNGK